MQMVQTIPKPDRSKPSRTENASVLPPRINPINVKPKPKPSVFQVLNLFMARDPKPIITEDQVTPELNRSPQIGLFLETPAYKIPKISAPREAAASSFHLRVIPSTIPAKNFPIA